MKMEQEMEILQGAVSAVVYQNYENGYSVLRLNVGGGQMVTVVGTIPMPAIGERLMVTGRWSNHSSYGRQFEAEFLERLLPQTAMEILSYLSSRVIKGIGPRMAARIVEHFGSETLLVMEREPERLAEVSGISREKARTIGEEFRLQVGMRQLMEFFALHHLPAELAVRTYKLYGDSTIELLYDDPYLLMEEGLEAPFGAVDRFAIELGVSGDDPRRVEAGILFELNYNLLAGHSFLPEEKLVPATCQLLSLGIVGSHAVPTGIVLHEGNILALDGGHHNSGGLAFDALGSIQCSFDLLEVVAIDCLHMEAEALQLLLVRIGAHNICHIAVDLQAVVVDDDAQVVQLVVACKHAGLPNLTFLSLAVAQQSIDTVGLTLDLGSQCHAAGGGNTLTQRTGGHIHAGDRIHIGVALQVAANLTQLQQVLHGEETAVCQSGIQAGCAVTLGQNETIPVLPLGVCRIHIQFLIIQIGKQFRCGHAAAGMAALGGMGALDDAHANLAGSDLQLLLFLGCHKILLDL